MGKTRFKGFKKDKKKKWSSSLYLYGGHNINNIVIINLNFTYNVTILLTVVFVTAFVLALISKKKYF